jgi:hypothetical protein
MAVATFNSIRGEKSALILLKANPLEFSATPVYVPRAGVEYFAKKRIADLAKGDTFEIPDGYKLVDMVDTETGEVRMAKDGSPLKQLAY